MALRAEFGHIVKPCIYFLVIATAVFTQVGQVFGVGFGVGQVDSPVVEVDAFRLCPVVACGHGYTECESQEG